MAQAITTALKKEENEEYEQHAAKIQELRTKYKITTTESGSIPTTFSNVIRCMRATFGYSEKQADIPVMTFELLKAISALLFLVVELFLIGVGFYIIGYAAFYTPNIFARAFQCVMGLLSIIVSSFFRIARLVNWHNGIYTNLFL